MIARNRAFCAAISMVAVVGASAPAAAQSGSSGTTPPGTRIENTATALFLDGTGAPAAPVLSNTVAVTTGVAPTPSITQLLKYAPGKTGAIGYPVGDTFCDQSGSGAGPFTLQGPPRDLMGNPIDVSQPVELLEDDTFHSGEPLFIRTVDSDQNLDGAVVEMIDVTLTTPIGDREVLRLEETGPNTGEFIGWIMTGGPPPVSGDCMLSVATDSMVEVAYVDPSDGADQSGDQGLVDPFGLVFSSGSGAPVDGATVTLIDAATGNPATVFGDDGTSTFPSTLISGGTATDSGGRVYDFPPGNYRFPFVVPGDYELRVTPPTGFQHPSVVADATLQALAPGPFALVTGSRGETFQVPIGPAVQVDIPLDPDTGGNLLLSKTAARSSVGIGEFVQYVVRLVNPEGAPIAMATELSDRLPPGFRYEGGSARIAGGAKLSPQISDDGRSLRFDLGDIPPGETVEIRYVTQVTPAARPGDRVNTAVARATPDLVSNVARASVRVEEDLLADRSFLVGHVMVGTCEDGPSEDPPTGVGRVRILMEDGRFVVTDDRGRFHFPAVAPGLHVVQLDVDSLPEEFEVSPCDANHRHAGRSFSQFVDLQPGTLWRTDFYVRPKPPQMGELSQRLWVERVGNEYRYALTLLADVASLERGSALVELPPDEEFVEGSAFLDGKPVEVQMMGSTLVARFGWLLADSSRRLVFRTRALEPVPSAAGEAVANFDEAAPRRPKPLTAAELTEPGAATRARGAAEEEEASEPEREPARAVVRGIGPSGERLVLPSAEPGAGPATIELEVPREHHDRTASRAAQPADPVPAPDRYDAAWLARAKPDTRWLYPEPDGAPDIASLRVGIQHDPKAKVTLFVNGAAVSGLNLEGRLLDPSRTRAMTRWRGIDLVEGPNALVAVVRDQDGSEQTLRRMVHYAGPPVRAEYVEDLSTPVADGRIDPVLAVRFTDRWGEPVRGGTTGHFELDVPYRAAEEVEAERTRPLAGLGFELPSYVVEDDGVAYIRLHPTSVVGEARLRFAFAHDPDRRQQLEAWLEPGDRDWVLVALASETLGWNIADGSSEARRDAGTEEGFFEEGRIAFYAKGKVKGDWLLTAAFDSRERDRDGESKLRDRLFQALDPDEHYTLYGDTTQQDFDAPTSDRVYVKIERRRFFALYGDFQTGLDETELARYDRKLTGGHTGYEGKHLRWNAFVAESDQRYVRDEIQGNGTSGLYQLSNRDVIINSETVTIQTRDRFRTELILAEEPLVRNVDYNIDYIDGTLYFRQPITSQDGNFDPRFIVVEYEVEGGENAITGGGRVAVGFLDDRAELGVTGIQENLGIEQGHMLGADLEVDISDKTRLRMEFAHTNRDGVGGQQRANAYLFDIDHRAEQLDLHAYYRELGRGFGLGQQNGTEAATRKWGLDAIWDIDDSLRLDSAAFRQENLATDDARNVIESELFWENGSYGLHGGTRYGYDQSSGEGRDGSSWQILGGGRVGFFEDRLALRLEGEAALAEDEAGEYPHRLILGGDLAVHEKVSLFIDQEFTWGDEQDAMDTRGGVRVNPWNGATFTSSIVQEQREYGPRTYSNLGLQQRWALTPQWSVDVTIDRADTIRENQGTPTREGNTPFNVNVPAVSGTTSDDFTAVSLGTGWNQGGWAVTGRAEARFGEEEDRYGVLFGLLRDESVDTSWAARLNFFASEAENGTEDLQVETRLSLAHRPDDPDWIVLERLDIDYQETVGGGFDFESVRLVNHLKLNHQWDPWTQLAWYYGLKYVVDTFDGEDASTFGNLVGFETRKDFAEKWDMSMHARLRYQSGGTTLSGSYGLSIGRILHQNLWVSVGYNFEGFYDREFSAADYTAQGPYIRMRAKFDQQSVRDALNWFSR